MRFITTLLVAAGMTLAAFAQTPSTVGVALQLGQVVQQWRRSAAGFGATAFNPGGSAAGASDNPRRFFTISGQALGLGFRAVAAKPDALITRGV